MFCHRCGVEVQPKQRFCGDCGVSLSGVTDPTEELIRPSPARAADPLITPSLTDQLPVTQAVTGVVPTVTHSRRRGAPKQVYDFASDEPDDITWMVGINVFGVVHGCKAFLPALLEADEAHIVNLSSMVAFVGLPQNAVYSLTKGAVRSFTEALRPPR